MSFGRIFQKAPLDVVKVGGLEEAQIIRFPESFQVEQKATDPTDAIAIDFGTGYIKAVIIPFRGLI